ncbi:uncharacterized protein BDR25DRAFT_205149, partial [Lindgomyces ingoldianus]
RACDSCKRRKVRCDASIPCANCRISHLDCAYTIPQRKRGPRMLPRSPIQASPAPQTPASMPPTPTMAPTPMMTVTTADGFASWEPADVDLPAIASPDSARSPRGIQDGLAVSLQAVLPSLNLLQVVTYCIDLYMQYTFPTAPLVHEPTLRANAALFFSDALPNPHHDAANEQERVALLRGFALVTAVCASVASVMPNSLIPYRHLLVKPFLHASRETLRSFEDYDLEHPNSASMVIRVFHSTALQHMTGKHGAAWHVQGQATLIAQTLHLYSEERLPRVDPVESKLLRLNFWHMYASDHVAAAFRDRTALLLEPLFYGGLTLQPDSGQEAPLVDPSKPWYDEAFEDRLLAGFHLFRRVSLSAAKLVLEIRKCAQVQGEQDRARLAQDYFEYTGLLDDLPHWLYVSNLETSDDDSEGVRFQKRSFWVQRCTILVTFHCFRLVILRQSTQSRMADITGLADDPLVLSMKNIEMISDFLQTLDDIPFIYLQVKGEPTVERIRRVGTILLELRLTTSNDAIRKRARTYGRRLLDILAMLNSKASDDLD